MNNNWEECHFNLLLVVEFWKSIICVFNLRSLINNNLFLSVYYRNIRTVVVLSGSLYAHIDRNML